MPLTSFTKTFDIPEVKGSFPHLFNQPDNYAYDVTQSALSNYYIDSMKNQTREKLLEWHAEHKHDRCVFSEELKAYCVSNVELMKAGCVRFRASFPETTGLDPFMKITIASACMEVFKRNFLKENTIGGSFYMLSFLLFNIKNK